jgi:hypothetical protein
MIFLWGVAGNQPDPHIAGAAARVPEPWVLTIASGPNPLSCLAGNTGGIGGPFGEVGAVWHGHPAVT